MSLLEMLSGREACRARLEVARVRASDPGRTSGNRAYWEQRAIYLAAELEEWATRIERARADLVRGEGGDHG